MSIYDILFLICFSLGIIILLYKIYNSLSDFALYDNRASIMLFTIWYLLYGVAFVTVMTSIAIAPEKLILISLFDFLSWIQLLNIALLFAEIAYKWKNSATQATKAYTPNWYWDGK